MDVFFQPERLVFTIPLMIALGLWLLVATGLLGHHDADGDLDGDLHVEVGHGWFDAGLHFLGFGLVPLSLSVTSILFGFGISGLVLHVAVADFFPSIWTKNAFFIPIALVFGLLISAVLSRLLQPFFKDYGAAATERELVGKLATVKSNKATSTFGAATLRLENGNEIEIAIRTERAGLELPYGSRVLLTGKLPGKDVFEVTAFDVS